MPDAAARSWEERRFRFEAEEDEEGEVAPPPPTLRFSGSSGGTGESFSEWFLGRSTRVEGESFCCCCWMRSEEGARGSERLPGSLRGWILVATKGAFPATAAATRRTSARDLLVATLLLVMTGAAAVEGSLFSSSLLPLPDVLYSGAVDLRGCFTGLSRGCFCSGCCCCCESCCPSDRTAVATTPPPALPLALLDLVAGGLAAACTGLLCGCLAPALWRAFLLTRPPAGLAGRGGGEGLFGAASPPPPGLLLFGCCCPVEFTRFSKLLMMASVLLLVTLTLCTGLRLSWTIRLLIGLLLSSASSGPESPSPESPPPTLSIRFVPTFSPRLEELGKREIMAIPLVLLAWTVTGLGVDEGLGGSAGGRFPSAMGGGRAGIPWSLRRTWALGGPGGSSITVTMLVLSARKL